MVYIISLSTLFVVALVALTNRLTALPGFEFSLIIACIAVPLSGWHRIYGRVLLGRLQQRYYFVLSNLSLLLLPLLLVLLNSLRLGNCDLVAGLLFYLLIPGVSVLFSTAVADFCSRLTKRRHIAILIYFGLLFLSLFYTLYRTLYGVQVFAFNPIFGYLPGPIYDPALSVDTRFVIYRLFIVVVAIWWFVADRRLLLQLRSKLSVIFYLATAIIALVWLFESHFGFHHSRSYLKRELGGVIEAEKLTLVYDSRLTPDRFVPDRFQSECYFWIRQIETELNVEVKQPITVYVYGDARSKKYLMGAGRTLIGDPINRELHFLPTRFPSTILKHELTHVIAGDFGIPIIRTGSTAGLLEGLAVALEGWWGDFTVHSWAKATMEMFGDRFRVNDLMEGFGFFKLSGAKSYSVAGSFVSFLMQQFGVDKLKLIYKSGDYQDVYGKDIDQLIAEWQQWLEGVELTDTMRQAMLTSLSRRGVLKQRCPHASANWREAGYQELKAKAMERATGCFLRSYGLSGGSSRDLYYILRATPPHSLEAYGLALALKQKGTYAKQVHHLLGDFYLVHDDPLLALRSYQRSLNVSFGLHNYLLKSMIETGLVEEAKEFLLLKEMSARVDWMKVFVAKDGGSPTTRIWLGLQLIKQGGKQYDPKTALKLLTREEDARVSKSLNTLRYLRLGEYYFNRGEYRKAILFFTAYPDSKQATLWRQRTLMEMAEASS